MHGVKWPIHSTRRSYERFRVATDSRQMMQYWEEMVSMWDAIPVPDDVLNIPKVVQV